MDRPACAIQPYHLSRTGVPLGRLGIPKSSGVVVEVEFLKDGRSTGNGRALGTVEVQVDGAEGPSSPVVVAVPISYAVEGS